jgi:cytochrome oxidase Cu insertion factor (SCO1/SenC/PrrC family)
MEGSDNYMFDHSAFLYLMDPDNKMVAFYPSSDTAESITKDIKNLNL